MRLNINRLVLHRAEHREQFLQIRNATIDNFPDTVGFPARWLFIVLMRLPPSFNPSAKTLCKRMRCDERTVRKYVAELKEAGYLETEVIAGQTIYHVYEKPKLMGNKE